MSDGSETPHTRANQLEALNQLERPVQCYEAYALMLSSDKQRPGGVYVFHSATEKTQPTAQAASTCTISSSCHSLCSHLVPYCRSIIDSLSPSHCAGCCVFCASAAFSALSLASICLS